MHIDESSHEDAQQAASQAESEARPGRRVFDCSLYNGEIDLLELRLEELDAHVDVFVVVEATRSFTGKKKARTLLDDWDRVRRFAPKLRYVVLRGFGGVNGPWEREKFQRNSCLNALLDAEPNDLILLSDVDEIPLAAAVDAARDDTEHDAFGFRQSFRYFAMNYCNVEGPEAAITWSVAFTAQVATRLTPEQVRYAVRDGTLSARIFDDGGWHFSYLGDVAGIRRKIRSFAHQEFNNEEFLDNLDVPRLITSRKDMFGREGFKWGVLGTDSDLPDFVLTHPEKYAKYMIAPDENLKSLRAQFGQPSLAERLKTRFTGAPAKAPGTSAPDPVIICPYLNPEDRTQFERAFGTNEERGKRLPIFFWQDIQRIGPEAAYQHCWSQFPDRDVIILHTDMAPLPNDQTNAWYDELLRMAGKLKDAGAIACDLLYDKPTPEGERLTQCAGGTFDDGAISHIHHTPYDDEYGHIRRAEWITFGGVYLRRAALDMCGSFDDGYQWAYVKDVDYSLEMRKRGWNLYQIPVALLHEENRSTKPYLEQIEYQQKVAGNYEYFYKKWGGFIDGDGMINARTRFQAQGLPAAGEAH